MHITHLRPAVVLIDESGALHRARRRERPVAMEMAKTPPAYSTG